MKNDEEMFQSLCARFRDYQERKQRRSRMLRRMLPFFACCVLAAVIALRSPAHPVQRTEIPVQQGTTAAPPAATSAAAITAKTEPPSAELTDSSTESVSAAVTAEPEITASPEASQTQANPESVPARTTAPHTEQTAAAGTAVPRTESAAPPVTAASAAPHPAESTAEPQTNPGTPGSPGAVFTSLTVSYEEARNTFAHPILPCGRDDFLCYKVGIVSRNGQTQADGAFCLSVTYEFTDGQITLTDRDRMNGSDSPGAEQTEYCGRTFYIQRPDAYDENLRIAYYAAGFDPFALSGIEYQAVFGKDADPEEIMDRIIALMF